MSKIYSLKNWELFLILFLLPLLIHWNLGLHAETLIPSVVFVMLWFFLVSTWIYHLATYFKTEYLKEIEIRFFKINLVVLNTLSLSLFTLLLNGLYRDRSSLDVLADILTKSQSYLGYYFCLSSVAVAFTASRILTAKRVERNLKFMDYFNRTISFVFLPIGIFWIQNDIAQLIDAKMQKSKVREYALIGVAFMMIIITVVGFNTSEISFGDDYQNDQEWMVDSTFRERAQQQFDSLFQTMNDSSKAALLFKEFNSQYNSGNFRGAINYLNYAIQYDSLNTLYYLNRSIVLSEQFNQQDSAILGLSKVIELSPSDWRAYRIRANCNFILNNYDVALADVDIAIKHNPDESTSYLLRGMIKENLNDTAGACLDFSKADSLGNEQAFRKVLADCY